MPAVALGGDKNFSQIVYLLPYCHNMMTVWRCKRYFVKVHTAALTGPKTDLNISAVFVSYWKNHLTCCSAYLKLQYCFVFHYCCFSTSLSKMNSDSRYRESKTAKLISVKSAYSQKPRRLAHASLCSPYWSEWCSPLSHQSDSRWSWAQWAGLNGW